MRRLLLFVLFFVSTSPLQAQSYYPGSWGDWEKKSPEKVGMNAKKIQAAIEYAQAEETDNPRSMEENHYGTFAREPFGDGIGPFKDRGEQTGIIVKDGYIIAEWGEPFRVDMTHSVTKSFLTTTVGVAYDRGLIRDVNDKVNAYMAPIYFMEWDNNQNKADRLKEPKVFEPFKGEHNSKITWNHLLRQTSDWEGTLWGKPDWADRPSGDRSEWMTRERHEPGTEWEYNDVRVNLLALAAMNVLREPLPKVLREEVMDKIGASPTWRWMGYENSWVIIDGQQMQAVSGGGHWGGGMFISARDQARFGLLTLRNGRWKDEQIISEEWNKMAQTPTEANSNYGFMNWFLNVNKDRLTSAPTTAFFHLGAGTNMVYVDQENDLVIVARWIKGSAMDGVVKRVLEAVE
ncbi:serine hydrolase domain-containing protein [Gracilimonas sediminicola]|uniref:Beta-lactamase family protein n=1 Tax=Gracilimonas sediminicola TaxID=2952158 RepID=A0A9X2L337_9BACT|nr:serine hydrolase [Gracilimonas sediminicola]MCP9291382.1 beta-lactamase family protein [Gracilimonas sediminicola]